MIIRQRFIEIYHDSLSSQVQNRPLDAMYPIVFIDAVHFSVQLAAYVILAVSLRRNWSRVLGELEIMYPDRLS